MTGEDDFTKFRDEIRRQSEQIERDGTSPERMCVHVQRINSHLRIAEYQINDLHKETVSLKSRIGVAESSLSQGNITLEESKKILQKLYTAILGDEELEQEGLLKMVKRHNKAFNESSTKRSIFRVWVFPVIIAVITAIATTLALKLIP